MTVSIFVDEGRAAAILMSDDPLYALGPAIVADDVNEAADALQAFVDALEAPADEMPTVRLMTEWTGFLAALHGLVMGDGGELVDQSAGADPVMADLATGQDKGRGPDHPAPPAPEVGAGRNGDTADPQAPPEAAQGAPGGDEPAEDDQEADVTPDELADRLAHVPGGTPRQRGEVECWNCGGTGEVQLLGNTTSCGVCQGTGRVESATA